MKVSVILACAGKGVRSGLSQNKILYPIGTDGENCLQKCLKVFADVGVDQIIVTSSDVDFDQIYNLCQNKATVVLGGATRTQSIKNALSQVTGDIVLIHDGARPFVTTKIIKDCIDGACKFGGVIPIIPSPDTIIKGENDLVCDYLGKANLYRVQTPQAFQTHLIKQAYSLAEGKTFNDDGEIFKQYISDLHFVDGDASNVKLTFAEDFATNQVRFGTGFDCHKLVENRKLILGGVTIPHDKGLLGHSDADVLTHAIMDAILSACALGDIGKHFPDNDMQYKDANSIELLKKVLSLIDQNGFMVQSVSATIMAEKPKLKGHIPTITQNLANVLGVSQDKVGVGATTLEGLGFVGREEGICVNATAVVVAK